MEITVDAIKELRDKSGAGVMDCRNALNKTSGNMEKAVELLKERGLLKAKDKAERITTEGLVEAYIHTGGKVGAMIELNCESDFVARTDEFKELAHNLAMQVASMSPRFVSEDDVPDEAAADPQTECLLLQPYIKDNEKTIEDLVVETIAKVGENIKISRFTRFELGVRELSE